MTHKKQFFEKLAKFRGLLNQMDWTPDGMNTHQNYRFLSESKMKGQIGPALTEAGLEWRSTYSDVRMLDPVGAMRTHVMLTLTVELFDDEDTVSYVAYGTAADSGDKAMSKAQTNALKNVIANNWLVSSFDAETEGEIESKHTAKAFVSAERVGEMKAELARRQAERKATEQARQEHEASKAQPEPMIPAGVTAIQRTAMGKVMDRLRTLDPTDLEQMGGLVALENEFNAIKTSQQAAEFISKYRGL